jgi:hypothetical protein
LIASRIAMLKQGAGLFLADRQPPAEPRDVLGAGRHAHAHLMP